MGEFADDCIEQGFDEMLRWEDEPEECWIEEYNDYPPNWSPPIRTKTCSCCGQEGLHWTNVDGKWRLADSKGVHKCPVKPLKEMEDREHEINQICYFWKYKGDLTRWGDWEKNKHKFPEIVEAYENYLQACRDMRDAVNKLGEEIE